MVFSEVTRVAGFDFFANSMPFSFVVFVVHKSYIQSAMELTLHRVCRRIIHDR